MLSEQLREEKVVEGEMWSTHHMAHEFCSADFADGDATFEIDSPMMDLSEGVQGSLRFARSESGESVDAWVVLFGFRGSAEFTTTAFRFGRGGPRQLSRTGTWKDDDDCGVGLSLTQAELADEGWLTPDNKIRLLLTLHLRPDAVPRAAV